MPSQLPGAVIFVVLLAAAITYPVSWLILSVYRRAVHRSMRRSAGFSDVDTQSIEPAPESLTASPSAADLARARRALAAIDPPLGA